MNVFLYRIKQLLRVLGSELLVPLIPGPSAAVIPQAPLICRSKGAYALGQPTPDGFIVYKGSTAVLAERPATARRQPYIIALRKSLVEDGTLLEQDGFFLFTKDTGFSSRSAAASVIHGGGVNGLTEWRTERSPD